MSLNLHRLLGDSPHPWALLLGATIVGVLAVGRFTRLIYHDSFPPAEWLRQRYLNRVTSDWSLLIVCPWCLAPWFTAIDLGWAMAGTINPDTASGTVWWISNVWLAASYVVSMVIVRDEPPA